MQDVYDKTIRKQAKNRKTMNDIIMDLFKDTLQRILEEEDHLGFKKHSSKGINTGNRLLKKTLKIRFGNKIKQFQ